MEEGIVEGVKQNKSPWQERGKGNAERGGGGGGKGGKAEREEMESDE